MTVYRFRHEIVSALGAYPLLTTIALQFGRAALSRADFASFLDDESEREHYLVDELAAENLLVTEGDEVALTALGFRTGVLLDALNSGDVTRAFDRLRLHEPSLNRYSLVREGMADEFLDGLITRPGFKRIYIASPWISLSSRNRDCLVSALVKEEGRGNEPELLILTRPKEGFPGTAPDSVAEVAARLRASVFLHPTLHTKLYIREPAQSGGYPVAIVGSQNLTRSRYAELGIRIEGDAQLIAQLVAYFFTLTTVATELV